MEKEIDWMLIVKRKEPFDMQVFKATGDSEAKEAKLICA